MENLDKAEELDICPPGFECPEGNRMPFLCKEGSFCPREGMTKGEICPAGYHCPEGTIDVYSDDTLRLVFIGKKRGVVFPGRPCPKIDLSLKTI